MPSALKISAAARNAATNAVVGLFHQHSLLIFQLYTGAPPVAPSQPPVGVQLASDTIATPMWTAASGGQAVLTSSKTLAAYNSGIAGHFRVLDAFATCHLQGTAGEAADATDITLSRKDIVAGSVLQINTLTLVTQE